MYAAAVAAVLGEYSPDVIARVSDPRTGVARTNKFLPSVNEISDACDAAKKYFDSCSQLFAKGYTNVDGVWYRPNGERV
jgi:hypothetical protein